MLIFSKKTKPHDDRHSALWLKQRLVVLMLLTSIVIALRSGASKRRRGRERDSVRLPPRSASSHQKKPNPKKCAFWHISRQALGSTLPSLTMTANMMQGLGGHTCETLKEKRANVHFPTASGHDSQDEPPKPPQPKCARVNVAMAVRKSRVPTIPSSAISR